MAELLKIAERKSPGQRLRKYLKNGAGDQLPLVPDKGKGDVDESFDEAAAVSFRAHHQRRGVRHHDRDPAPRIEVRPGLLGCNRTKNCFSGSECGGRSAKHVNCRKVAFLVVQPIPRRGASALRVGELSEFFAVEF